MHGDWLDIVLVVLVALSAFSGYRQGFVVGILSLIGLLGGGVIGAEIAPSIAHHFAGSAEAIAGVVVVFAAASLGRAVAGALGAVVRRQLHWRQARAVDSAGGAVVSAVAVLLVAWFIGSSLVQSPFPGVAREVNGSRVLTAVDRAVPSQVQVWFADFRKVVANGGFPQVFGALGAERIVPVAPPDPATLRDPQVVAAQGSVLKISGTARSCSRQIEGSGFVFAPGRVMTNAHVVAGVRSPSVQLSDGRRMRATVVYYDPHVDVAVLAVAGLDAKPLSFDTGISGLGTSAAIAGYPQDGPYTLTSVRIRGVENARGPDIYQDRQVTRQVYSLRGDVEPGNSGGPLIDTAGHVDGVVFGKAVNDAETGYALTASQVSAAASAGATATQQVSTQGCD
ncbi:MAG: MarP family serine protease [Acidothermaceae bacterium]